MKKIVIALILVVGLSIAFCACNSQTNQNNEGTSASAEVSSSVETSENTTQKDSKGKASTTKKGDKESATLKTVDSGDEYEITVPFEEEDGSTTKNSGKEKTTKKSKEKTTKKKKESSSEGYELPIIPIQ